MKDDVMIRKSDVDLMYNELIDSIIEKVIQRLPKQVNVNNRLEGNNIEA